MSTAIKNHSESTSDRHSAVDLGGVSTAISKSNASLAQLYITSALYKPTSERKLLLRSGVDRVVVSTAISKAKAYPAQQYTPARYITFDQRAERLSIAAVYQQQSAQQTPLRHRPADICNIASTSVYQQWAAEPKARLEHTTESIRTVYQPRSTNRMPVYTREQIMQNNEGARGKLSRTPSPPQNVFFQDLFAFFTLFA